MPLPSRLLRFAFAASHPKIALSYLRFESKIAALIGSSRTQLKAVLKEPELLQISTHVTDALGAYREMILGPTDKPRKSAAIYAIIRLMRPQTVVETGVQSGISSSFILKAMERNGKGALYSIDLPDEKLLSIIPPNNRNDLRSGWLVPKELKPRWQLILGRSQEKLVQLMDELAKVDIFIHDSEHSYQTMIWEYSTAWHYLSQGGMLLSDDVNSNHAFRDFCNQIHRQGIILIHPLGGTRKL